MPYNYLIYKKKLYYGILPQFGEKFSLILYFKAVSLYALNEPRDRSTNKWNSYKRTLNTSLKK